VMRHKRLDHPGLTPAGCSGIFRLADRMQRYFQPAC
jgi:hypothetical protein